MLSVFLKIPIITAQVFSIWTKLIQVAYGGLLLLKFAKASGRFV